MTKGGGSKIDQPLREREECHGGRGGNWRRREKKGSISIPSSAAAAEKKRKREEEFEKKERGGIREEAHERELRRNTYCA